MINNIQTVSVKDSAAHLFMSEDDNQGKQLELGHLPFGDPDGWSRGSGATENFTAAANC